MQRTDYEHLDHEPLAVLLNAFPASEPVVKARKLPGAGLEPSARLRFWCIIGTVLPLPRLATLPVPSRASCPWGRVATPCRAPLQAMSGPEDDVYAQVEKRAVAANSRMALNSRFWSNLYVTQLRNKVAAGTFESRKVRGRQRRWTRGRRAGLSAAAPLCRHSVLV